MRTTLPALLLAAALTVSACSSDEPSTEPGSPSPTTSDGATLEPDDVPLKAEPGRMTGVVSKESRKRAVGNVAETVDRWWQDAYLGGDYPRGRFGDSFAVFTTGAERLAKQQAALMSNKSIGQRIEGVYAVKRTVAVDLLGVRGRPVAATAHLRLKFLTAGDLERTYTVTGSVRLVPQGNRWRIFAYDVAKGRAA